MPQGKKTVEDREIVNAIKSHEDPFVGATEVAEMFGLTRQWAHNRLTDLHERGEVKKKAPGTSSVIWWVEEN